MFLHNIPICSLIDSHLAIYLSNSHTNHSHVGHLDREVSDEDHKHITDHRAANSQN